MRNLLLGGKTDLLNQLVSSFYFVGENFNTPVGQSNSIKMPCISHRSHETKGSSSQTLPHFIFALTSNNSLDLLLAKASEETQTLFPLAGLTGT